MNNYRNMKIVRGILLAVTIVCLIPMGQACHSSFRQRQQAKALKEMREMIEPEPLEIAGKPAGTETDGVPRGTDGVPQETGGELRETSAPAGEPSAETEKPRPPLLEKYAALYEENHDLAGWLSIEGTVIDYPVMQCEDDEYYLHHDFYGNDSKYGCLYVRGVADVDTPGTNFIIYGHNMKDGSMFGDLDLYRRESFYREHPTISFDTLYEERTYEVLAVFRSQVYRSGEDAFRYYQFYEAQTQEAFDYFYDNIKELALYDTGVTAEFGDTFLTLSTCAYHVEDGRFVVVAKAAPAEN